MKKTKRRPEEISEAEPPAKKLKQESSGNSLL
jgi:hypothetical protein